TRGLLTGSAVPPPRRRRGLPGVPPSAGSGVANSTVQTWFALPAPAATPRDVVQRLNTEVRRALAAPDVQQRFAEISLSVNPTSPEELDATIKAEAVRWAEVISRAGIRAPE